MANYFKVFDMKLSLYIQADYLKQLRRTVIGKRRRVVKQSWGTGREVTKRGWGEGGSQWTTMKLERGGVENRWS